MTNIEYKTRLKDRPAAESACLNIGAQFKGVIKQRDVYFKVREGRFKLRISDPPDDYLVYYRRPDVPGSKRCDYVIAHGDPDLEPVLSQTLGVIAVVEKERTLYLWENVRIHLDRVEGLGDFLEFEAVLQSESDEQKGRRQLYYLRRQFNLPEEGLAQSYLELISMDRL